MTLILDGTNGVTFPDSSVQDVAGLTDGYTEKVWINFNGTGTVAIRESGNASSITDNGTGDYTISFTNSLTDAQYCSNGGAGYDSTNPYRYCFFYGPAAGTQTSALQRMAIGYNLATLYDAGTIMVSVTR